jgi:hypothetical protein
MKEEDELSVYYNLENTGWRERMVAEIYNSNGFIIVPVLFVLCIKKRDI